MHTKCTNKNCPYDHDILKSVHNRRIIEIRGLTWISGPLLHDLTRASADPDRSVKIDFSNKLIFVENSFLFCFMIYLVLGM